MSTSTTKRELTTSEMKAIKRLEKIDMDMPEKKIKKAALKIIVQSLHQDVREEYEDVLAQANLLNSTI